MNVVTPHDWIGIVLDPNPRQSISADLVVLVRALGIVGNVQANVLAVAYVAMADYRIGTNTVYTYGCTDWKNCKNIGCQNKIKDRKKEIRKEKKVMYYKT